MKRLLITVAVLGLVAGAPALADNDHHHGNGGGGPGHTTGGGGGGGSQGQHQHGNGGGGGGGGNGHQHGTTSMGQMGTMSGPSYGNAMSGNPMSGHHHAHTTNQNGVNVITGGNNFRGNGNVTVTRRNFSAPRQFHAGTYQRPQGWYPHRWRYGEHLPAAFFLSTYWLSDYNDFDLDVPPPGYVWVRYGDDALLVNRFTGEIVEVEYGVFY